MVFGVIALLSVTLVVSQDHVTYIPGTLPVILSAPHGGSIRPASIPDRQNGCWVSSACLWTSPSCTPKDSARCGASTAADMNTRELTLEISDAFQAQFGRRPHVILNNLHRIKLDANREVGEAAQGNAEAILAFNRFQNFITDARNTVTQRCRRGLYIDVHGQAHAEQWIEWGFLLTGAQWDGNDAAVDALASISSVRALTNTGARLSVIGRSRQSLAGILSSGGSNGNYKSVPSPEHPGPRGGGYFSGGYNTLTHGSRNGGTIDGIQMEVNSNLRNDDANARRTFASRLVTAIGTYLANFYNLNLRTDPCLGELAFGNMTALLGEIEKEVANTDMSPWE